MKILKHGIWYLLSMSVMAQQIGVVIKRKESETEERVSNLTFLQQLIEHPQEIVPVQTTASVASAFHTMVGDPLYQKKTSLQLNYIHHMQLAPDFTTMAVITGAQVHLYTLRSLEQEHLFQEYQTLLLGKPVKSVHWDQEAQRILIVSEHDTEISGAWYHQVAGYFVYEKEATMQEVAFQEPTKKPDGIPHTIDQAVWNKQGDEVACLRDKFDIYLYRRADNGSYEKIDSIPYQHKKLTLIRALYATETLSKIIVWLNNHTIVVYQRTMDLAGTIRFCKTQEIESVHIMDVALSPRGDLLLVHTIGNSIDLYSLMTPHVRSTDQMLLLPALQKCLLTEEGRGWIAKKRKMIEALVETYNQDYGAWVTERWVDEALSPLWCYKPSLLHHKKIWAGMSLLVGTFMYFGSK